MNTILVTGGAGFIGSHLCERLLGRGDGVVCYDSFDPYYDVSLKERNIAPFRTHPRFALVRGDLLDVPRLESVFTEHGVTGVAHLGARAGVRPSIEQPTLYNMVNVCGSTNLLEAARKHGLSSVVMASSSSVYGANTKTPFHEDDPVCLPISPYAASKRSMELAAYVYYALYGMDVICLRFFTVYGPRQRPDMAISRFVQYVREGKTVDMYGTGDTRRDYTYIADIIDGLVASLDRARGLGYQIINLGNSRTVELRELIAAIGRATGREPIVRQLPEQPGDVKITYADVKKAHHLLGYDPKTSVQEGLARFVTWLDTGS